MCFSRKPVIVHPGIRQGSARCGGPLTQNNTTREAMKVVTTHPCAGDNEPASCPENIRNGINYTRDTGERAGAGHGYRHS